MSDRPQRRVALYVAERSEYALRVHEGVLRYCEDHAGIALRDFRDEVASPQRHCALLAGPTPWSDWNPDGIVGIFPHGAEVVPWVKGFGVPAVSLSGEFRDDLSTVHISPASIADAAIQHFLAMGYSNFAFVGVEGFVSVDQRRSAMERHLSEIGRGLLSYGFINNPWPGLYQAEAAAAAEVGLHQLLLNAPKPLGVLCTTDQAGRAVCIACRQLGLAVPQEVGVLGIDNYLAARGCLPPLSSIHTPGESVGYEGMKMLISLMNGQSVTTPHLVRATRIVTRQSTGAGASSPDSDVVRALAIIRERACDGAVIDEMIDHLPISRSTLERQFMTMLGRTPGQEMLRVRLLRAKELLRTSELPITQIAGLVGYERSSSFSDFFKKAVGISPREYRATGGPSDSGE
ncbi:MAG TPA: substrate-binding domain-containing protein [Tepidisphaeraceae bacterium]|nr:substrate-binding domain-containing protein [Tepidisphaeraceae bacterium]